MEYLITFCSGAAGAALVAGIFSLIQYALKRRDKQNDDDDAERKALRYIMLYIIQERCKDHIREGQITLEDLRSLHHWHNLYHDGLGGNGDADALLRQVESLRIITD